jgi:uncharacterized phage-associated protein
MSRPFQFFPEKAIEAVAFLLRRERGHRMNYMRLLKVLYIAEREILAEAGTPLTGSNFVAMQRGPVLEDVDRYHLEMLKDPGVRLLSRYVSRKLEEVAVRYENFDEWQMVEVTHKLPEWQKNAPGTSSREIPLADILEAVGRAGDLERIIANAREDERARTFFDEPSAVATAQSC